MHKVFLFGSRDIYGIPDEVTNHLERIMVETHGDVEFLVGDAPGVDASFHRALSSVGAARKSTVYCMDFPRNNKYEFPTKSYKSEYNPETFEVKLAADGEEPTIITGIKKPDDLKYNRQYYEFKDKQMRDACTFAICIWDGKSKGTFTNINVLKAQNKYVYVYRV